MLIGMEGDVLLICIRKNGLVEWVVPPGVRRLRTEKKNNARSGVRL